jgi:hypothetical protein
MPMFPDIPTVPPAQLATANLRLQYHDLCLDGRVMISALPPAIGGVVWRRLLADHPFARPAMSASLALPLLTRLTIDAGSETITLDRPVRGSGGFQLAHTRDDGGEVHRLIVNMWVELFGTSGRFHLPAPPNAPEVRAGRVFAEHVFTRPFANPEDRRVRRFEVEGFPTVPEATHVWRSAADLIELPPGATALDPDLVDDPSPVVFGLHHTDTNQHVNSLVYPRLFEDAALRRIAAHGRSPKLLARAAEIAYRKPCFAGETLALAVRAFESDAGCGAVGWFRAASEARPRCTVRMVFSP